MKMNHELKNKLNKFMKNPCKATPEDIKLMAEEVSRYYQILERQTDYCKEYTEQHKEERKAYMRQYMKEYRNRKMNKGD